MARIKLHLPLDKAELAGLAAGDQISLSGTVYTARDEAHKRLLAMLENKKELPFALQDAAIYYTGPCPAPPGQVIGSAGPTTSSRLDPYTQPLLEHGLKVMIGKGQRSQAVLDAMVQHGAVYFGATGGAGALLAEKIRSARLLAWPELGPEAIYQLEFSDFPLIVLVDTKGQNIYRTGPARYNICRNTPCFS